MPLQDPDLLDHGLLALSEEGDRGLHLFPLPREILGVLLETEEDVLRLLDFEFAAEDQLVVRVFLIGLLAV